MVRRFQWLVWILLLHILVAVGAAGAESALQPQWLLRTELRLENVGTTTMHRAIIQVPLILESSAYGIVVSQGFNLALERVVVLDCGTRTGIFRVGQLEPGETVSVRLEYSIDPDASASLVPRAEDVLSSSPVDAAILTQALDLTRGMQGRQDKFRALQAFTHQHMSYALNSPWRNGDAAQALQQAEGVCEDYANLLVALSQAAGIPARTIYGYVLTPRSGRWIRHAWVEYLSSEGDWQSADPTFSPEPGLDASVQYLAQGYSNVSARVRFVGGRLAGSWHEEVVTIDQSAD